ncbi:LytR/AlgR family response regulator transcription factor [Tenacibaculum agarivorans]|uniref:LytR/AlgR family response regulator transcription factor n=1 Tax=Tenacibaculum agarivorans TaxID=1908389 RepID=UPI0009FACB65|nr:LytTR family DNA-binding domain-containing protein [Tenacibaculum agarivorans]
MKNFFNSFYPFYYDVRTGILIGVLIFILSILFSFLFEPFEVNYSELKYSYFIVVVIHSLVSFCVFMIVTLFLNSKKSEEKDWKVKHELILLLTILLLIGVVQFLIRDFIYNKDDNWSLRYLFEEVRNTLLVGGLFIFIITSLNIERLKSNYNKRAHKIKIDEKEEINEREEIQITTQVKSDDFVLNINDFNFAKSDKNYVEIYLQNSDILIKRMTIRSLETQLFNYNFILKTHRSFIVNLRSIIDIKGNAQGYKLSLKNSDAKIPVSRNQLTLFEEKMIQVNI